MVDEDAYEILDLGPGKTVLSKINDNKFTENECGVDANTPVYDEQIHGSNSTERNNGNCDVRCLVLFTENAAAAEPGNMVNRVILPSIKLIWGCLTATLYNNSTLFQPGCKIQWQKNGCKRRTGQCEAVEK